MKARLRRSRSSSSSTCNHRQRQQQETETRRYNLLSSKLCFYYTQLYVLFLLIESARVGVAQPYPEPHSVLNKDKNASKTAGNSSILTVPDSQNPDGLLNKLLSKNEEDEERREKQKKEEQQEKEEDDYGHEFDWDYFGNDNEDNATIKIVDDAINQAKLYEAFMDWCKRVLGIETILEIRTFEYYDYMRALPSPDDDDDEDLFYDLLRKKYNHKNNNISNQLQYKANVHSEQDYPRIPVRGLQASRDIEIDEIVIRIPLQSLLTVSTIVDKDPVLTRVMGPEARRIHGWYLGQDDLRQGDSDILVDDELDQRADFFELPLLAVALLHHRSLGKASPIYPYIQMLLSSPIDSMPFLWERDDDRWKTVSEGIRSTAKSLRKEMQEMYQIVLDVLIDENPALFGPPSKRDKREWFFSYTHFKWAFAMVNSRHWQLHISDLENEIKDGNRHESHERTKEEEDLAFSVDGEIPPAAMPTESWVHQLELENEDKIEKKDVKPIQTMFSFLAPVADLLNFGPPCTKVRYNEELHTFDVTASCRLLKGQEVTFWYSDECDHIIIGNYGFTHPMVPICPTAEDYHDSRDHWRHRAEKLENQLHNAYYDLDNIHGELDRLQSVLGDCECCKDKLKPKSSKRHQGLRKDEQQRNQNHVRGSINNKDEDLDRHGVRRMWQERRSDL